MNVDNLIKDLMKIENKQMEVFFITGKNLPVMKGISIPVEEVTRQTVVTLKGPQPAVVITGK